MAGYSGTPLAKKLGIKEGGRVFLANAPDHYARLVAPLPPGVQFDTRMTKQTDIVHLFATSKKALSARLKVTRKSLRPDASIWVSWPKKSAKVATDITEDTVRELAFPLGLVDIKVCAVDDIWSGLKLVVRRENR
jgi:hypothetical protein